MSCDIDIKIPALFDPLSPSGQQILKELGFGASGLQEAFDKYAKELSNNLKPLEAKLKDATDIFEKHYRDSADRAYKWLNETSARGPVAEAYVNKLAQGYAAQAQAISNNTVSAAQRLANESASNKAALDRWAPSVLSKIGTAADAAQLIDAISRGDTNGFMENLAQMAAMAAAAAAVAAAVAGIAAAAAVATPAALAAIAAAAGAVAIGYFGDAAFKKFGELTGPWVRAIGEAIGEAAAKAAMEVFCDNKAFRDGLNWRRPSDPLVLDLDGDGVELTVGDADVLFDHNKDNIRTGTQWVKPDDGILVRDLNGNGAIDSGKELFGDQTQLANGQLATNGWQALAALDSNRDGIINASDAAFAELKVWRDLNQDGISQANELQTLTQAGVSSINLAPANQATGSYTTTAGTTRVAQNIDFTTNNFYSEFTDNPTPTATAAGLPQLQGAGFVRDMREAMSLGTAQSQTLQQTITSFKAATTTQDRQALLDQVITAWANTSGMGDAKARNPLTPALLSSGGGGWYVSSPAQAIADFAQKQPALYAQLSALERFNGQPVIERYTRATSSSYYDAATGSYKGYTFYTVSIEPQRLPFFQTAYDSLKASTYQSLYLQTEGKELLDQIELVIDDKGLRLDFASVDATLAQKIASNPGQAAVDLAEFIGFTADSLASSGWDGAAQLGELRNTTAIKLNTTRACKRRRCATKTRAACARVCWARSIKASELIVKRRANCISAAIPRLAEYRHALAVNKR